MPIQPRTGRKLEPSLLSVLLVDDQPFFRVLLTEVLRQMGVREISTAVDGEDALEAFDMVQPDLVLTDWLMPNMDGLELTRCIRNLSDTEARAVPIVLVTSNNRKSQIDLAKTAGVDNFILKPVSVKAVADRLRDVVERPRPFVDSEDYKGPCRRRRELEGYRGPFRRYDDPMELDTEEENREALNSMVQMAAERIAVLVRALRKGDLSTLKPIRLATDEIRSMSTELDDHHMVKACTELARYLDRLPDPKLVRVDVIQTHLEAMEVLIKTPIDQVKIRDQVVIGLGKVVAKFLKAA